jgi:hypothetical protein
MPTTTTTSEILAIESMWHYYMSNEELSAHALPIPDPDSVRKLTVNGKAVMCGFGKHTQMDLFLGLLATPEPGSQLYNKELAEVVTKVNEAFNKLVKPVLADARKKTKARNLQATVLLTERGLELAFCVPLRNRLPAPVPGTVPIPQGGSASNVKASTATAGKGKVALTANAGKTQVRVSG